MTTICTGYPGSIFTPRSTIMVDDSTQLVAYRLNCFGKANMNWTINHKGHCIGHISRRDSKWVHDNWEINYTDDDEVRKSFLTRENRQTWDRTLHSLTMKIRQAFKKRESDIVTHDLP